MKVLGEPQDGLLVDVSGDKLMYWTLVNVEDPGDMVSLLLNNTVLISCTSALRSFCQSSHSFIRWESTLDVDIHSLKEKGY